MRDLTKRLNVNSSFSIHHRFPFDWRNPLGFLTAFVFIYIFQMNIMFLITYCVSFEVCVYIFVTTFIKDIKNDLFTLSEMVKLDPSLTELQKQLSGFIQFHSKLKRFVRIIM